MLCHSARCLILIVCTAIAACATQAPAPRLADDSPADFTLEVTVRSPRAGEVPRAMRAGRYILEPGGSLRAAVGPGASHQTYPPRAADLAPIDVERIWRLVRDSGLLTDSSPYAISTPDDAWASASRAIAIVTLVIDGQRSTFAVPLEDPNPTPRNVAAIVDRLARLAGVPG